jgi:GxxExxY protein
MRAAMERSLEDLSHEIIGACLEVHTYLGPGLLESTYEECVAHELKRRGISCERQVPLSLAFKELELSNAYRMDLLVERQIVLELKTVERLLPVHQAQILTYLRLGGLPMGLLVNFYGAHLRGQIRRFVGDAMTRQHAPK